MAEIKRKVPATRSDETGWVKFTAKQLAVYYWLVSISYYNSYQKEKHYFLYLKDISYNKIARELGIGSSNTVKSAIQKLAKEHYISLEEGVIKIPHKNAYTYLNTKLIKFLLAWSTELGAELLLYYSVLKRFFELNNEIGKKTHFNTKLMVKLLGHNGTDNSIYKQFKLYLIFLESYGLIRCTREIKVVNGGEFIEYTLWNISDTVTNECNYDESNEEDISVDKEILEKLNLQLIAE